MKKTKSPYIVVKKSRIHSTGVFAKKDIPKDTEILPYVGEKITKREGEKRGDREFEKSRKNKKNGAVYLFSLNKRYDIDGNVPYNTAKFINHSCEPNCEVVLIGNEFWVIALRDIKKGEELAYNYGYDEIEEYEDHPCNCGSSCCVGYILDEILWTKLKSLKKNKKSR